MAQYAVVIEKRGSSFRAYVPDLPGCTTTGSSAAEAEHALRDLMRIPLANGASVTLPGAGFLGAAGFVPVLPSP